MSPDIVSHVNVQIVLSLTTVALQDIVILKVKWQHTSNVDAVIFLPDK